MSDAANTARPPGGSPRTRLAAVLVLIGLAAVAYYALFSGPTTVPLPAHPGAAPARTAPPHGGEEPEGGRGD